MKQSVGKLSKSIMYKDKKIAFNNITHTHVYSYRSGNALEASQLVSDKYFFLGHFIYEEVLPYCYNYFDQFFLSFIFSRFSYRRNIFEFFFG